MFRYLLASVLVSSIVTRAQEQARPPSEINQSSATTGIASVRIELEAMLETDQTGRLQAIELERSHGRNSTKVREVMSRQGSIDALNIQRLEAIIAEHGWPGSTQFGSKAAKAAFLILQHSDISYQTKYLALAKAAAVKGEMPPSSYALLEDRVRLRTGKKQIFGSQVTRNAFDEWEPLPLEDEEKVDALRARVGLGPISGYLEGFVKRSGGRVNPKWIREKKEPLHEPEPTALPGRGSK